MRWMKAFSVVALAGALAACEGDGPAADDLGLDAAVDAAPADAGRDAAVDAAEAADAAGSPDLSVADAGPTDAAPDLGPDAAAEPAARLVRTPCFVGEPTAVDLDPLPQTCVELYAARPDLETGCYVLDDGTGAAAETYCWRRRALVLLVNNNIEAEVHPDDTDADGTVDRGDAIGQNHPPDPLAPTAAETAARLQREITDWFGEVSYGALWIDAADVYWEPGVDGAPDRWFRLQRERPGFANADLFTRICQLRGGVTAAEWRRYDFFVTIITDGTVTSGSQKRTEALPVGEDCADTVDIRADYLVVKRFGSWYRLGTLFHELGHGLGRDPLDEPSVGHSEALHAETGESAEYGDLTDVMGESGERGHFSLPQKLFLRFLPRGAVVEVPEIDGVTEVTLHPTERNVEETKGALIRVDRGRSYHVEARRNLGNDSRLPDLFYDGVLIKRANEIAAANKSWIVDPTPETPTVRSDDSVLLPQRTFADRENRVFVSLLANDENAATIEVRRGDPSAANPVVDRVDVALEGRTATLTAHATPGDAAVPADELLYFWKPTPPDAPYTAGAWRSGREVSFAATAERQVWLLVSDRRGGETWVAVDVPGAKD